MHLMFLFLLILNQINETPRAIKCFRLDIPRTQRMIESIHDGSSFIKFMRVYHKYEKKRALFFLALRVPKNFP